MSIFKSHNNIDNRNPWTADFIVWASRPYGSEQTRLTVPLWLSLVGFVLILFNVIGWSIVGLVELVQRVF